MRWLLALALVACTATPEPCRDVTCASGSTCEPASGACVPGPRDLPRLDDLDLGAATRAFADEPAGLVVVSLDREVGRLVALRLGPTGEVRDARVVAGSGATPSFAAALDHGRLAVLAPDDAGTHLTLVRPFEPEIPPLEVALGASLRVRGAVSLAVRDAALDAAFADDRGELYLVRFAPDGASPAPERVDLQAGDTSSLAEPVLRSFAGGRSFLFFLDESTRQLRVAGRETGAWRAETLLDGVRTGLGPSFAAEILPDGNLAVLAVDDAGRLVLAIRTASGGTHTVIDAGAGPEALRRRVGAWPAIAIDPLDHVTVGAYDVTAGAYRAWRLGVDRRPLAPALVAGALLAPVLVAGPAGSLLVAGVPETRGALWVRRLAVFPMGAGAPAP